MARETKTEEDQRLMDEWLAKGNKVEICPPRTRTDPDDIAYTWVRGRKKAKPEEEKKSRDVALIAPSRGRFTL